MLLQDGTQVAGIPVVGHGQVGAKIFNFYVKFDPNLHQAMLEVEDESVEPGIIVQEVQPGYKYGERLLRPSFVGVSKKKTPKNEKNEEKKDEE